MPLREAIVREIRRGALKQPWTTADLLKNRSLIKEFAISTLRTEPPNCSRSVEGLALGDGVAPWEDLREVGHSELGAGLANLRR